MKGQTRSLNSIAIRGGSAGSRGITLAMKFVLVLALAYFLTPVQVGVYGLVAASVTYALYVVTLDFYAYSAREVSARPPSDWAPILRAHAGVLGIGSAVALPLLLALFFGEVLPWTVLMWFLLLAYFEALGQELVRLLTAMGRPLLASLLVFLRGGAWPGVLVLVMWKFPATRDVDTVLMAWAIGSASACAIGALSILRMRLPGWSTKLGREWVRTGLRMALPFLLATLVLRSMFVLDRYLVRETVGPSVLGAYVLFAAIAFALLGLLEAGVFAFLGPPLIRSAADSDAANFKDLVRRMTRQTTVACAGFAVISTPAVFGVTALLPEEVYRENFEIYPVLMLAFSAYALSMVPHYVLYARRADRAIRRSHWTSAVFFLTTCMLGTMTGSALAVPLCLTLSFVLLGVMKWMGARRLPPLSVPLPEM